MSVLHYLRQAAVPKFYAAKLKAAVVVKGWGQDTPPGTENRDLRYQNKNPNWHAAAGTPVALARWNGKWIIFVPANKPTRALSLTTEAAKRLVVTDRLQDKPVPLTSALLTNAWHLMEHSYRYGL